MGTQQSSQFLLLGFSRIVMSRNTPFLRFTFRNCLAEIAALLPEVVILLPEVAVLLPELSNVWLC